MSRQAKYLNAPKYLFDFYALTENQLCNNAIPILYTVKDKFLHDVRYCIYRELRHLEISLHTYGLPKYFCHFNGDYIGGHEQFCQMTFELYLSYCKGSFLQKTIKVFLSNKWNCGYGGSAWSDISKSAYLLEKDDFKDIRKTVNLLDDLVHRNHNNGNCLNKLYPNIEYFLNAKRKRKDTFWLNKNSSKAITIYKNKKKLNLL